MYNYYYRESESFSRKENGFSEARTGEAVKVNRFLGCTKRNVSPWISSRDLVGFRDDPFPGNWKKRKRGIRESAKEESDRPWLRAERVTGTERSGVERSQVVTDL